MMDDNGKVNGLDDDSSARDLDRNLDGVCDGNPGDSNAVMKITIVKA